VELVRALLEGGDMSSADADAAARVLLGAYAEATLHVLTTGETGATVRVVERMIDAFV
jgi:hypothetical protein